jgi:hypothetical protein
MGVLTGTPETAGIYLENVDATTSQVAIYDATVGGWVALVELTWATLAATVAGTGKGTADSAHVEDLGIGPNGGQVVRLTATATPNNAGNTRTFYTYPTGSTTNTDTVIIHGTGHEVGAYATSPIISPTAGTVRGGDAFHWLDGPDGLTDEAGYIRFIAGADFSAQTYARILQLSGAANTNPRLFIYHTLGSIAVYHNGTYANHTLLADAGDVVECAWVRTAADGLRSMLRVNGGAVDGNAFIASAAVAYSGQLVSLGSAPGGSKASSHQYADLRIVRPADLDAVLTSDTVMDELAAYDYLTAPEG